MSDDRYPLDTSAEAKLRFEADGLEVVFPKANELQIDIDSDAQYAEFNRLFEAFTRNTGRDLKITRDEPSRSGLPKRHVTIDFGEDVNDTTRLALQAVLGSDPMRECLSFCRHLAGDPHPSLFVETVPV